MLPRWLYTPRGCAVFYVPIRNQHLIRTSIPTSHGYESPIAGKPRFVSLFEFVATIDYTPYLCVPDALKFRREVCGGEEVIRNYCTTLALKGGQRVAEILGTFTMDNRTHTITDCCFTNVLLPLKFPSNATSEVADFAEGEAEAVQKWLNITAVKEFDTYLQIGFCGGALWVRLSGQVYLGIEDFEWVGWRLKELCGRARAGEFLRSNTSGVNLQARMGG